MNYPQTPIGLPSSLNYTLPPSASPSARSFSVNVSPDGITSVQGPPLTATTFVVNAPGVLGSFNSQVVSFSLPCGQSDSVFLDTNCTTISFTLIYTVSTALAATGALFNIKSSAASFFDQLTLYSNNVPIESINQYGLLQNFLIQNGVSASERNGGLSVAMGCDSNTSTGLDLNLKDTGTFRYNFTIPLLSIIGANMNDNKLFPIGMIQNLQLLMTTANQLPMVSFCTAVTTQPAIPAGFQLSEFTLNLKYVDIGADASAILRTTLNNNKWFIKANTYINSSATLPSGSSGSQQLLFQIRNTSLKSLYHTFSIAQNAVSPNGDYDSLNPQLSSRQLQIGSNFYPTKALNDTARPSESYQYLIAALVQNGGLLHSMGTTINRYMYCTLLSPTGVSGQDSTYTTPALCVRTFANVTDESTSTNVIKFPNSFYCGYDLELNSGPQLFQGINTRSSPPFLSLNLLTTLGNTVNVNAWGLCDVILEVDAMSKSITAYI